MSILHPTGSAAASPGHMHPMGSAEARSGHSPLPGFTVHLLKR